MATISNQFSPLGQRADLNVPPRSASRSVDSRHDDKLSAQADRVQLGQRVDLTVPPRSASRSLDGRHDDKLSAEADRVQLTQEAESLLENRKATGSESLTDEARIHALKQAIENGEYQVSSERLAKNILKFEQNFA